MPRTTDPPLRDETLARLRPRQAALLPRAQAGLAGLPSQRWHERPASGGWSIAEVLEHLCLAHLPYLDHALPGAIARAGSSRPFSTSMLGRLLIATVREGSTRRLPTGGPMQVRRVRDDVDQVFLASLQRLDALMHQADGRDLNTSLRSPFLWWLQLKLGETFIMVVEHSHRHLAQAERCRRAIGG